MGYVVVHRDPSSEKDYRDYLLLVTRRLLDRGIGLDRVPRLPANGEAHRWLYVADDEAEAKSLAEELNRYTEGDGWEVRPADQTPTTGPLRPLGVEVCWEPTGFALGLDPLTEWALEARFPGCRRYKQVFVEADLRDRTPSGEVVRELAVDVLPLLVRLTPEVRRAFGGFEVVQPVTAQVLVSSVPFQL